MSYGASIEIRLLRGEMSTEITAAAWSAARESLGGGPINSPSDLLTARRFRPGKSSAAAWGLGTERRFIASKVRP